MSRKVPQIVETLGWRLVSLHSPWIIWKFVISVTIWRRQLPWITIFRPKMVQPAFLTGIYYYIKSDSIFKKAKKVSFKNQAVKFLFNIHLNQWLNFCLKTTKFNLVTVFLILHLAKKRLKIYDTCWGATGLYLGVDA